MSNKDHNPRDLPPEAEPVEPTAPETLAAAPGDVPGELPGELPSAGEWAKAQADIEALKAELKDQQLRAVAELDNVRKRARRDVEQSVKFGSEKLLAELLDIGDSLEQALKTGAQAAVQPMNASTAQALIEGAQLTQRQFNNVLEKHGVQALNPVGEAFNPELHEAMTVVESTEVPANHVLQVVQTGYCLHQRLLRPARVIVAKAPAGAA